MRSATVVLAVVLSAGVASSDTVHLRNGSMLHGRVMESGDKVLVEMDFGTVTISKSDVARVVYDRSPLQELEERERAIDGNDAEALYRLGVWAKQKELATRAAELFRRAVAVDPDHAGARGELGYRRHEGKWLTEDEVQAALGKVRFRGAWMERAEVDRILLAEQSQRQESARESLMTEAKRKLLEAEADLVRAKAETERMRAALEQAAAMPVVRTVYVPLAVHVHRTATGSRFCMCRQGPKAAPACGEK